MELDEMSIDYSYKPRSFFRKNSIEGEKNV